jgi:uncharacterized protein YqeY
MSLLETLSADMKAAMFAKDTLTRDTLRMILAGVKNMKIELGRELEEGDVRAAVLRGVKTRKDSLEQYEKAGREDLASIERTEIEVLSKYLPKALDEDEIRAIVAEAITAVGAESKRDMGKVMKHVLASHKGAADGKAVSRITGELLS